MPGTLTVNATATFSTMLLLSATQKMVFGKPDEPDIAKTGEKKFAIECAVTFLSENGMKPVSEVITVGIVGGELPTIPPGTPIEFDTLRAGVSAPEKRDNGRISGGKLYWMASGIRAASSYRAGKSDAA